MALDRLRSSLAGSPVVKFGDYDYFVHPITDGLPLGDPAVHHVPDRGPPEVVAHAPRHAGLPARRGPGCPVVPPALAEPMLTIQIREQIGDDPPGLALGSPDPCELRREQPL